MGQDIRALESMEKQGTLPKYKQNLHVLGNRVYSYTTHVATIEGNSLIVHGYWSMTTSKHINYVAGYYGLTKREGERVAEQTA